MNKQKCNLMIIAIMALTLVFGVTGCTSKPEESTSAAKSGVEKNYGLAYQSGTINVDESNPKDAFDAADVVPDENTLTTNLEGKGYDIEKTETVFDSDINATTISAKKINSFCVITIVSIKRKPKKFSKHMRRNITKMITYHGAEWRICLLHE